MYYLLFSIHVFPPLTSPPPQSTDLGCHTSGCVDLRHLADRLPPEAMPRARGLKTLSRDLLSVDYMSLKWAARTDWELPCLTAPQRRYASLDAIVGAMLAVEMMALIDATTTASLSALCAPFVDVKYRMCGGGGSSAGGGADASRKISSSAANSSSAAASSFAASKFARQNPLYHNCRMLAPDGELMCTLDRCVWGRLHKLENSHLRQLLAKNIYPSIMAVERGEI